MASITSTEIQNLTNSPAAIVEAINDRLQQIHALDDRYIELTQKSVAADIPYAVTADVTAPPTTVSYQDNGVTLPREDGAVRVRTWDDFVSAALESADEATRRWALERSKQPWILIQDTLTVPGINRLQRFIIGTNCANSRMLNAFIGGSNYKGWSWPAYQIFFKEDGTFQLGENEIPDAFAVTDDLTTLSGSVRSKGWRIADLPLLAKRSLAHFILTSGASTAPLGSNPFGRK